MEMVERVAKAIDAARDTSLNYGAAYDRDLARAAIEAMRKPTEAMIRAAQGAYEDDWEYGLTDADMARCFKAMITAALQEQPK